MKIYTRIEHVWDGRCYVLARAEWFDYTGPMALCDAGEGVGDAGGSKGASPESFSPADAPGSAGAFDAAGDGTGVDAGLTSSDAGLAAATPSVADSVKAGATAVKDGAGKVLTDPLGKAAVQTGLSLGVNSLQASRADAFNKQLAGLVSNANNQSYGASQAVPLAPAAPATPGLSGSSGAPGSPEATVANMNVAAPITPASATGTQSAPSSPQQTGAVKFGARPQMYA